MFLTFTLFSGRGTFLRSIMTNILCFQCRGIKLIKIYSQLHYAGYVDIMDMTFIAEYTVYVDYLENGQNDDCNSVITLLSTDDPSKKLVIFP